MCFFFPEKMKNTEADYHAIVLALQDGAPIQRARRNRYLMQGMRLREVADLYSLNPDAPGQTLGFLRRTGHYMDNLIQDQLGDIGNNELALAEEPEDVSSQSFFFVESINIIMCTQKTLKFNPLFLTPEVTHYFLLRCFKYFALLYAQRICMSSQNCLRKNESVTL